MYETTGSVKSACFKCMINIASELSPLDAQKIGFSEELLFLIQSLTNRQAYELSNKNLESIMSLKLNETALKNVIENILNNKDDHQQAIEFIKRGASTPLMAALFGMQSLEVSAIRKGLGVSECGGRPRCSIEQRLDVLDAWNKAAIQDEKEKYLHVCNETGISLKVIHMVLMQEESMKSDEINNKVGA